MARQKETTQLEELTGDVIADPEPRFYTVQATYGDDSLFENIRFQLAEIHAMGGQVLGVTFQSPSRAGILAYVPPNETDEAAPAA